MTKATRVEVGVLDRGVHRQALKRQSGQVSFVQLSHVIFAARELKLSRK